MKKIVSVLLALSLCAALCVPAFAGTQANAVSNRLKDLATSLKSNLAPYVENVVVAARENGGAFFSLLLDTFSGAGATALTLPSVLPGSAAPDAPTEGGNPFTGGKYSVGELTRLIRKYMFIELDDPAEAAALIAETTDFTYALVEDGRGTLYMRVNVEDNPQIFNYDVFRALVEQLYARQNEELKTDAYGNVDYVMSYEHIAGELALHAIVFAAMNLILDVTKTQDAQILRLYRAAAQAELNADENRAPTGVIRLLGTLIINVFRFNFLKLFGFLA